jgi:hypothetical protein
MTYTVELLTAKGQVVDRQKFLSKSRASRCQDLVDSQIKARSAKLALISEYPCNLRQVQRLCPGRGAIARTRLVEPQEIPATDRIEKPADSPRQATNRDRDTDRMVRQPVIDFRARAAGDDA